MRIGRAGTELIKSFEQCRLRAYMPTPNDRPTIGWGATRNLDGTPVRMGQVWTQAEADINFMHSLAEFSDKVWRMVAPAPRTTQNQFDAMVSLAYNIGTGPQGFGGSTLLRMHNAGNIAGAADQFSRWNKQAGRVLPGLTRRRAAEAELYRRG